MSSPTLSTAIEGYLITKSAKGLSNFTLRNYRNNLKRFTKWLQDPPIDTITSRQIETYFKYLNEDYIIDTVGSYKIPDPRPLSAKSIQNTWATLSNFWKWVEVEFEIGNPFHIPRIKANNKPVDPVPQEEVEALLHVCDYALRENGDAKCSSRRSTAKRNKALILTLLDTGMRVSEVCNVTVGDIDFKISRIYVTGKGDKSRYVYFGKICGKALWRYFVERFPDGKTRKTDPFFVSADRIHPMNRNSVRLLVGGLGKKVGNDNLHPFGLSPFLLQKSVPKTLTSAWIELSICIVGIIIGVAIHRVMSVLFQREKIIIEKQIKILTIGYFLLFILSIAGGIFSLVMNTKYRFDILYILLMGVSIIFFWLAAVLGHRLYGIAQNKLKVSSHLIFRFFYPSFYIYLFATIVASVFLLSRIAVWRGHTLAIRDLGDNSHLPNITLYSQSPLPFSYSRVYSEDIYKYENLKLVDMNEGYIFVLEDQHNQTNPSQKLNHVYIIPKDKLELFELFR